MIRCGVGDIIQGECVEEKRWPGQRLKELQHSREGGLRRAASEVSRRGGEWNMDVRVRDSFQVEGIVISVTWFHLAHSIRTNICLLGLESWKSSMKAVLEAF